MPYRSAHNGDRGWDFKLCVTTTVEVAVETTSQWVEQWSVINADTLASLHLDEG
jgi:hypothetical protein